MPRSAAWCVGLLDRGAIEVALDVAVEKVGLTGDRFGFAGCTLAPRRIAEGLALDVVAARR